MASGNTQTANCRPAPALLPGSTVADGFVTAGTFANVKGVVRNDVNTRDSNITSLGWNTSLRHHGRLVADGRPQLFQGRARTSDAGNLFRHRSRLERGPSTPSGFRLDGDGVATFTHNLNYADPNLIRLTSPQGWGGDIIPGGQDGYLNTPSIDDEMKAVRFEAVTS